MSAKALVVMAKRPFPGQTKTRLVPPFTLEEAAALYESFLHDTLELARAVANVTPFVAYTPADIETAAYFCHLAPDFELVAQTGPTLGERLDGVLTGCLDKSFDQVAAMNSDSPTLPPAYLDEAFNRLDDPDTDVVIGPCDDGGYYLIGWKQPHPRLVREVQMSTDQVLVDTLAIAAAEKLNVSLLPPWFDVDNLADLRRILLDRSESPSGAIHTRRFLRDRLHKSVRLL
jgi:rSAM/selenodomain-associated transferase 1